MPSSKLNIVVSYTGPILKSFGIIYYTIYVMILGQNSSNHIRPLKNFAARVFCLYILGNFNKILIGNLRMDLFENKFDLHCENAHISLSRGPIT